MGDALAKEIRKDRKDRNGLENAAGRHHTGKEEIFYCMEVRC